MKSSIDLLMLFEGWKIKERFSLRIERSVVDIYPIIVDESTTFFNRDDIIER